MTWIEALSTQAQQHHRCWSELIATLDSQQASFRLDPQGPSIAWLLEHCCEETDTSLEALLKRPRLLGAAWQAEKGWDALRQSWQRVSESLLTGLATLDEHDLDLPCAVEVHPAFADSLTSRRIWLQGHVFHLAYHLGQANMIHAASNRIPPSTS